MIFLSEKRTDRLILAVLVTLVILAQGAPFRRPGQPAMERG